MKYYSTNGRAPLATLKKAVQKGLAEDRGLYMPERLVQLDESFLNNMKDMSLQEIGLHVATAFFGEDVEPAALKRIVDETLCFPIPLVEVEKNIFSLELFHGPTLAFKDVGARFMARMLRHFGSSEGKGLVNVLVATSGDTGSAVANGFLGVEGVHVYVLYPKGKVSPIQECQFTTLGQNITAIEVDGVFDDCQALVKSAFVDADLNQHMVLTSANSINVARFLPQSFYYFHAIAQLQKMGFDAAGQVVGCVPSGNFGNICSALFGHKMGMPIKRFIAANNSNDTFFRFLQTGDYQAKASVATIANAMDVGDPSNFARIWDLYGKDVDAIRRDITGTTYTDAQIAESLRNCLSETGYQLDPHGACGYRALKENLQPGEIGFFLETAHPAKFKDTVEGITGRTVEIPESLQAFMKGEKQSIACSKDFADFKAFLLSR